MAPSSRAGRSGSPSAAQGSRSLAELLAKLPDAPLLPRNGATRVDSVVADSRRVSPGALFVAVRGTRADGHDFVREAVRAGAVAVVVERVPAHDPGVPVVRVPDARRALAELAARWHGRPAERLRLVGITGTVGKTSVLSAMGALLPAAGLRAGLIGSLGSSGPGSTPEHPGLTAPDPLRLHEELARLAAESCDLAVMEVTSHALVQRRVHGLRYELGVFTNLLPLEHADYHGSFLAYVKAKGRFLAHLLPGAPLVFNADDPAVRQLIGGYQGPLVACGAAPGANVRIEDVDVSPRGTRFALAAPDALPRPDGGETRPFRAVLHVPLLGRGNVANVALAATAAICLGAPPDAVPEVAAALVPPRRRMQVVHRGRFTVLDDTVGHPDSVSGLFEVVERLRPRRVHVAWAVRGRRGAGINRRCAEALAVWAVRVPPATLVVTRSVEAAGAADRVDAVEHRAFVLPLRRAGVPFVERERLDEAVWKVMERARDGDLVLLAGAQGMDGAREIALDWLEAHAGGGERPRSGSAE